jgi:hypothetical protein
MSVLFEGGEMVEIKGMQDPSEGIDVGYQVDRHREIAGEWIAAAIAGIREMHEDELARRRVAARLF